MRKGGVEPPPLAGLDPKSSASANSATFAAVRPRISVPEFPVEALGPGEAGSNESKTDFEIRSFDQLQNLANRVDNVNACEFEIRGSSRRVFPLWQASKLEHRSRIGLRVIVLLSGGLDSAVALYWAKSQGWHIDTIEFEYHLRPGQERKACVRLRNSAGIARGIIVPLPFVREAADIAGRELANPALRHAPQGYIPLRNLVFYSLSAYHAEITGARYIVGGHNRTDCESFPDAGMSFWDQLNRIFETAMWSHSKVKTKILLPLINMSKVEVIQLGMRLDVPFHVTWSCYGDEKQPCGTCESCIERDQAFREAGYFREIP